MTTATKFAGIAALDVPPADCYAVYEGLAGSIGRSFDGLGAVLAKVDDGASKRLSEVREAAPQVLATAAGYCWLNTAFEAIARNDLPSFRTLMAQFCRFEAAAAVSTGMSFKGDAPFPGPVSLPGTGLVVVPERTGLAVVGGRPSSEHWSMPLVGSLRADGYEPLLRSPRSMSQFELEEPSRLTAARGADELRAARELADTIVPGLFDRYMTDVVPLVADPGVAHAGTDDAAPWAVYLSFGREPADLIAALAHEESHALVQTLGKLVPDLLPDSQADMPVPWKPGVRRTLSGVLHGLIAFGRAATVRARAARAGHDSPSNAEALDREQGWVTSVTDGLLSGILGELPDGLPEWLQENVDAIQAPPPGSQPGIVTLGQDGGEPQSFQWRLLGGGEIRRAAGELFPITARSRWVRGSLDYPDQDRADLDAPPHPLLNGRIPALIEREWGARVELATVKVHRLRTGDRIRPHTDSQHDGFTHRLVLGLSPHDLKSGELRLLTAEQEVTLGTQPQFGQALLFELADPSFHEVTENRSPYPRYTLIASYRSSQ